jgi:hypothetical protein
VGKEGGGLITLTTEEEAATPDATLSISLVARAALLTQFILPP